MLKTATALALALGLLAAAPCDAAEPEAKHAFRVNEKAYYPEGPTIWRDTLYWAEMSAHRVRRLRNGKADTVWEHKGCGPTSVKRDAERGFWILCHLMHTVILVDNEFHETARFDRDEDGGALPWPNDASVDASGRLYFSSSGVFDLGAPATGRVFFIDGDHRVRSIVGGLRYANGVYLDEFRRRLYVSEHLNRKIHLFDLSGPGVISKHRVFFDFEAAGIQRPAYPLAGPDGLRLSANGLYVAEYGAGRIHVISPEGKLLKTIPVATQFVTNMEFWREHGILVVVGTYDNSSPSLEGRVISMRQ